MQQKSNRLFTLLRIALAVAMLVYLGQSGSINWSSLSGLAKAWQYTLAAIMLFIIASTFMALRLQILVNAQHLSLSFFAAVQLTFIGIFFNTYLPGATGGDLVKIYYASKGNPGKRAEVVTILFLDRFIGLFCLLSVPLVLAPFFSDMVSSQNVLRGLLTISLSVSLGIVIISIIGARTDIENNRFLGWVFEKLPLGGILKRVLSTIHFYRHHKITIIKAILLSFIVQFLMIGVSLFVSEAINPSAFDARMIVLIPLGYLATSLPVTPGGIGVGEAALESLFNLFGLQGGAEILLGWRIIMVIVGLIGLAFYMKGKKRFVFSPELENQN
ncbi:MAG: lysylphosphatidylglycerol synthase transmembrane domain-containing protein [Gammaproteobacteria bacterium]